MIDLDQKTDIVIVGAGPIGLACGIAAKRSGLSHVIIDKGTLVNSVFNYPYGMSFFSTSDKLEIGGVPFISHNPKPTRMEALEYFRRVAQSQGLNTSLFNPVSSIFKEGGTFKVVTKKGSYESKHVILSTGFYDLPHKLNVKGEDLLKVSHYYKEPHPYYDQKLAIIGAANSAVDAALECYRKGAKEVCMIIRQKEIKESVKYWVKPDIENRIKEGSIKAYFESELAEIRDGEIDINTAEGKLTIKNDFVLAMTGYEPDYNFIKAIGVEINDEYPFSPRYNSNTMETNVKGLYLAGVICGGLQTNKWFIENSRVHADMIIEAIENL
ncbi:MAG: thioredoxin reductase (NADPH) [Marivirga sp.]|jgi:thioredoxin reductase (NADPH)